MLISLSRKFIFIANLKAASTAIEEVLRPISQIALVESRFGKHMPYQLIERRFSWIFDLVKRQDFLIFGVIRDPVDSVISLYNSHRDTKFKDDPNLYTGNMSFDEFLDRWPEKNKDQIRPQFTRFIGSNGKIGANYIISYPRLDEGLEYIAAILRVPGLRQLPRSNVSEPSIRRTDLTASQLVWISERFSDDERFITRFCDRALSDADRELLVPVAESHSVRELEPRQQ